MEDPGLILFYCLGSVYLLLTLVGTCLLIISFLPGQSNRKFAVLPRAVYAVSTGFCAGEKTPA